MGTDRPEPTGVVPTNACGPKIFPTNMDKSPGYITEQN